MSDPWYDDEQVDRLVLESIAASGGDAVDLPTILDRIDGAERTAFPHRVLEASFRRLSDDGLIRIVESWSFARAGERISERSAFRAGPRTRPCGVCLRTT